MNSDTADVTRPLHGTGQMCDAGLEVLYTNGGAVALPEGYRFKHIDPDDVLIAYHRKGLAVNNLIIA